MTNRQNEQEYMAKVLQIFCDEFRGKRQSEFTRPFWDAVVITTMDVEQKTGYEIQLKNKIENYELPIDVPYHVIADPPGYKIGNGGSTMHCLDVLYDIYGSELYDKRIILIHAGGISQRMPHMSVPGKVFLPFPVGNPIFQALELLLAMYSPFIVKMKPGVVVACSDMLITYSLNDIDSDWSFEKPGFTALAHPSAVSQGEQHGVYVLSKPLTENQLNRYACNAECVKVLQKPSLKKMKEEGAIMTDKNGTPFVYCDSCFYFDSQVAKTLLAFYRAHKPLRCEIDGYGDFLPALGSNATSDHTQCHRNVLNVDDDLLEMRLKIFNLLKTFPINLIVLNESRFYHVGTLRELIENFCTERELIENLGLGRIIASKVIGNGPISQLSGVIMHSALHHGSTVPPNSIIAYCNFNVPILFGNLNIISNCSYEEQNGHELRPISMPDNIMVHTIPIIKNDVTYFATVAFGIDDEMKHFVEMSDVKKLHYFGKSMDSVLKILRIDSQHAFQQGKCSLWNVKIFTYWPTKSESFKSTLDKVIAIKRGITMSSTEESKSLMSMEDILKRKDASILFSNGRSLRCLIYR